MQYEYLEHTADVKIKAYGETLSKKFENTALAMFNVLTDISKVKQLKTLEINIESKKTKSLLYDFLEELLFKLDTDGFILSSIKVNIEDNKLKAIAKGDNYKNYNVKGNIKSITYSDMEITDDHIIVVVDV